jgi:two-component system response regulator
MADPTYTPSKEFSKPPSIVLVEDNPDDELLTIRSFKKNNLNYDITVLRTGEEAIDYFNEQGSADSPLFVLLDLNLPKKSGLEVLQQLRAMPEGNRIPVIVLTSSVEPADLTACYDNGANAYVQKPIQFEQFTKAVKTFVDFWIDLNRTPEYRLSPVVS